MQTKVSRGPYSAISAELDQGSQADASAKFDETVEVTARLGVDPRHADQQVRGTVVLPHGTGKTIRVLVFAKGEKEQGGQGRRRRFRRAPSTWSRRSRKAGSISTRSSPRPT